MGGITDKLGDWADSGPGKFLDTLGGVGWMALGGGSGVNEMVEDFTGTNQQEAANQAAALQYQATMAGIAEQKRALQQQRSDLSPFRNLAFADGYGNERPRQTLSGGSQAKSASYSTKLDPSQSATGGNPFFNKTNTAPRPVNSSIARPVNSNPYTAPTLSPISELKRNALNQESYAYSPSKDSLLNNALSRTVRSVMDAQAAKGKLGSGSTLTSLTEAMAPIYMNREQQVFENRYNANNQQFNQLQNIVGMAQNAAAGQGAATANTTNNITDLRTQGANAQAAGQIGAANAQAQGTQNLVGLAAAIAPFFMGSDRRLKEDVKRVGKMNDGTPIYTYKYKQGDGKTHMGVMAQEARKKHPDAVRKDPLTNMLMVNYSRL